MNKQEKLRFKELKHKAKIAYDDMTTKEHLELADLYNKDTDRTNRKTIAIIILSALISLSALCVSIVVAILL